MRSGVKRVANNTGQIHTSISRRITLVANSLKNQPLFRSLSKNVTNNTSHTISSNCNIASAIRSMSTSVSSETETFESPTVPSKLRDVLVVGSVVDGFEVLLSRSFPSMNLNVFFLKHVVSGADYIHIEREDSDNAFCVALRTMPSDNNGVAHILEHTALCGSEKYPVRDPFFLLLRRSLATFMNAMTRPEATYYPFSTQNPVDFNNLLGVYLDAVFFPLLNKYDFMQEGHRLEVKSAEDRERERDLSRVSSENCGTDSIAVVDGMEIDMMDGMEEEQDPLLPMKIISEMGLDAKNMTEQDLKRVSEELSRRLGNNEDLDPDADEDLVDTSLSSEAMEVHTSHLPEAAYEEMDRLDRELHSNILSRVDGEGSEPVKTKDNIELVIKGVVFNEMKGALSDPGSLFHLEMEKELFQSSIYRNNSGGDPLAIPHLTHEQLITFHQTHYHPSNACFYTYGDAPPRLAEIDDVITRKLLQLKESNGGVSVPAAITAREVPSLLGESSRFSEPRARHAFGPPTMNANGRVNKFSLSWLCRDECMTDLSSPSLISSTLDTDSLNNTHLFRGCVVEGAPVDGEGVWTDAQVNEFNAHTRPGAFMPSSESQNVSVSLNLDDSSYLSHAVTRSAQFTTDYNRSVGNGDVHPLPNPLLPVSPLMQRDIRHFQTLDSESRDALNRAFEDVSMSVLGMMLLDSPYSPLFDLLNDANINNGPSPTTGMDTHHYTTYFSVGMSGVGVGQVDAQVSSVLAALHRIAETGEGMSCSQIDAIIHQVELSLKDVQRNYGVNFIQRLVGSYAQNKRVDMQLEVMDHLYRLQDNFHRYGSVYLRTLLKFHILSNPHRLLYVMTDDPTYNARMVQRETEYTALQRESLSSSDIEEIQKNAALLEARQNEPVDASVLPTLSVEDIRREATVYSPQLAIVGGNIALPTVQRPLLTLVDPNQALKSSLSGVDRVVASPGDTSNQTVVPTPQLERQVIINEQPTNGLVSVRCVIDDVLDRLLPHQLPMLPLLSLVMGKLGTLDQDYRQHTNLLDLHTGGLSLGFQHEYVKTAAPSLNDPSLGGPLSDRQFRYELQAIVGLKCLSQNVAVASQLLIDSLTRPDFSQHLYTLLCQHYGSLSTSLQDSSISFALKDAQSRVHASHGHSKHNSPSNPHSMGVCDNIMSGLPHLNHVTSLFHRIVNETSAIDASNPALVEGEEVDFEAADSAVLDVATLNNKNVPVGVTVSPSLMTLANDLAETLRCLLLGPAHSRAMSVVRLDNSPAAINSNAYVSSPSLESNFDVDSTMRLPSCVTSEATTHYTQYGLFGFTRLIVSGDKLSLGSSATVNSVTSIINSTFAVEARAYDNIVNKIPVYLYQSSCPEFEVDDSTLINKRDLLATSLAASMSGDMWSNREYVVDVDVNTKMEIDTHGNLVDIFGISDKKTDVTSSPVLDRVRAEVSVCGVKTTYAAAQTWSDSTRSARDWLDTHIVKLGGEKSIRSHHYIAIASQVNSIAAVMTTVDHTDAHNAHLMVLAELLTDNYLHKHIREQGGAYGAFASQSRYGQFVMGSYRDPHCIQTLERMREAIEWAKIEGNITEQMVVEAKLGIFSSIDSPELPLNKGVFSYLRNMNNQERQLFREQLLDCSVSQVVEVAQKYLHFGTAHVTVVGGVDQIPADIKQDAKSDNGKWVITAM